MRLGLKSKFSIPIAIVLVAAFTIIFLFSMNSYKKILIDVMEEKTDVALSVFMHQAAETDISLKLLKASMNRNYLRITRSVREIIESDSFIRSSENFQNLAESLGVDEIHITDENGVLRWGNIEGFYGFDFHTSDQTLPFIAALTDPYFEMAQEPQKRGADNVLFQYITIAGKKNPGIIQIGITPEELEVAAKNYDLQMAIKKFKVDNYGGFPFILSRDGIFQNHPNATYVGKNVTTLVWGERLLNSNDGNGSFIYSDIDGEHLITFRYSGETIYGSLANIDPYLAPFWGMMKILLIIFLSVFIIISIIMFFIITITAVKPLVKVNNMLKDIL